MHAQDGEDKGEYKLTDLHLYYEIIESEELVRNIKDQYNVGRFLGYDYTTLLKTLRGGPVDILGGGVSDPKKKFMQEIELEKKIPACA